MPASIRSHGFEGSRLPYLLMKAGLFHEAHRALDECLRCSRFLPTLIAPSCRSYWSGPDKSSESGPSSPGSS
ncbi:hypothetical protein CI1B_43470 [Bradyrhizobium ivorense]|uniref:Uncharacterized protein n=1 Tax=Bradyrhizobium ivorense TaxID=2511166 RepID=A0A508TE61_9BRAD|nr:hypothetical protein CI1B_43470 [Bradyrhizobium ivorense]